ncbi:uroporphyrinogen decarboxylase family protein [uncultured Desulfosarcina sp.]|uniref:uroporphyrinogen decarboxylase family protein n=1 Tax=uncultured Desulfosarcina sp. TaxID=218289 RepID=UPI0029C97351|nr:uroporphyrinogen decarboxylase family protein [uncultured Desulfosarcina sp.]
MGEITQRQRFLGTLLGGDTDRFPYFDLEPDEDTLRRWHREGFPRKKSVAKYFNLESHHSVGLMLHSYPFYQKASSLLYDPSAFKRHYDPAQRSRYVRGFEKKCERLRQEGRVLYVDASGGGLLQMLGVGDWDSLRAACFALIKRPQMVEDLVRRTTDFYCDCLKRVLSKVSVDYAAFYEPIASTRAPVISPAMFERFAIPGYKQVIALLKYYNVPLRILCTTGGDLTPLLPGLIDAGINGLWISNIHSAGMEYIKLRRQFGSEVALIGGIDSTALTRDKAAVHGVVEETVPVLLESGHYLPCLDDRPRSNVPFAHYLLYRRLLEEITQKGR